MKVKRNTYMAKALTLSSLMVITVFFILWTGLSESDGCCMLGVSTAWVAIVCIMSRHRFQSGSNGLFRWKQN